MNKKIFGGLFSGGILLALAGYSVAADMILSAPPRESVDAGEKLYAPLAKHVSELIGATVIYQHPGNWLNYQRNMRSDKYDIIFDDPHFISWRIAHIKNDVLVKLSGTMKFYLVANKSDETIHSLNNLVGQTICAIPSPDISSLTVLEKFPNPARQPVIYGVNGGMEKVYKAFSSGKCKASVLGAVFFENKLKQQQREKFKILFQSKPLPNRGITVSQRLSAKDKNIILQSLSLGVGVKANNTVINHYSEKMHKSFVPATNSEYSGYNMLLEGIIFGW